jgi:hypothetical protein
METASECASAGFHLVLFESFFSPFLLISILSPFSRIRQRRSISLASNEEVNEVRHSPSSEIGFHNPVLSLLHRFIVQVSFPCPVLFLHDQLRKTRNERRSRKSGGGDVV